MNPVMGNALVRIVFLTRQYARIKPRYQIARIADRPCAGIPMRVRIALNLREIHRSSRLI